MNFWKKLFGRRSADRPLTFSILDSVDSFINLHIDVETSHKNREGKTEATSTHREAIYVFGRMEDLAKLKQVWDQGIQTRKDLKYLELLHKATFEDYDKILNGTLKDLSRLQSLDVAIRRILSQKGDDICWRDVYVELAGLVGVDFNPDLLPKAQMLKNCEHFIDCMKAGKHYETPDPAKAIIDKIDKTIKEVDVLPVSFTLRRWLLEKLEWFKK